MRRIEILAPHSRADAVLRVLHRLGTVQLITFEPTSGMAAAVFGPPGPSAAVTRLETLAELVSGLAEALQAERPPAGLLRELWTLDEAALTARVNALRPLRQQVVELQASRERLLSEQSRLTGYRRIVESLRPVVERLPALRGYGSTAVIIQARYRPVLAAVRQELESITDGRCETVAADIEGDRVAALLVYPVASAERVRSLLGGRDLEELTLPEELAGLPFDDLVARLEQRITAAADGAAAAAQDLATLAERHAPEVAALRLVLDDRLGEARALAAGAASDHLVMLSGWVPAARLEQLRKRLAAEVGADVWVEERAPDRSADADAPVAIQNPPLMRAFAPLAAFISLPRYGTLDPTPLLALTFPIFVGLMVGDIGYGLVLVAALLLARRRWRHAAWMATVTPVAGVAALSTILFGLLFGEAFGTLGKDLFGLRPLLFDRAEAVTEFLLLALAIGVGQVGIGLVLGIVNAALQRKSHELAARAGMLAVLAATLVAIGWLVGFVPAGAGMAALAMLAVALAVLIASFGLAGPVEAIGMLGNVLSYARLMAIGMASVMLALVANQLGGVAGNVVMGFFVALLLHTVNLVIGFFDASVQGLRLHYVEFFSKFVEPGGTPYRPFVSALGTAGGSVQ